MTAPELLPIASVLPDVQAALDAGSRAILIAPPGAGKTTAVAPALLSAPWCTGQILLLSPRRLAARAAAERMAEQMGERAGATVGYVTRLDSRQSAATRIIVATAGVFRNRIIADPELSGVSAVLFDEVHERSLDSDFGLALAIEAQANFRPDLRLLAMSATLDGERFAAVLSDGPIIESAGRMYPLTLHYAGRDTMLDLHADMARLIRRALGEIPAGDVLAFLPSLRDIDRTVEALRGVDAVVLPLHGLLDPVAQRDAIRALPGGQRKVILATSIAETSLTIDGVRIVVDSGLARRPRFDVAAGMTRLVTERASQAAVTQRAGRAGRQAPGTVYRLWHEAANGGMPPFDPPEILDTDLAPLMLDCAAWGEGDPARLPWVDPPPAAGLAEARKRVVALAALDDRGAITPHGRAIAALPLAPHIAHMVVHARRMGQGDHAARLAVLLSEHGLGGRSDDIEQRLIRWGQDRGARADAARALARRLAGSARGVSRTDVTHNTAALIALAWPDRVARRRDARGEQWQSVGGRGFRLDSHSPLASAEWLAVADVQGTTRDARILSAARLDGADIASLFGDWMTTVTVAHYDRDADRVVAEEVVRLGAITLQKRPDSKITIAERTRILVAAVTTHGLVLLPMGPACAQLRARAHYALPALLDDAALLATLDVWLAPLLQTVRRLGDIADERIAHALTDMLPWDARATLDRLAPAHYRSPAGSTHAIDYGAEAGPTVTLRVQALFGEHRHPCIGDPPVPLVLSLTSPAGRPIQTTRDLPGFWAGSWADVRRDMRGRYPRHPWPDDPTAADPTLRTKAATLRAKA